MSRRTALVLASLGVAAGAGCYTGPSVDPIPTVQGRATAIDGTDPKSDEDDASEAGIAAMTGIPCDVARVLATSCTGCHGARPSGGAPNPLTTYEDLAASATSNPAMSVASASVARMKATKRPMPPEGVLPATDIAVVEAWVSAGLPRGSCGSAPTMPDGGGGDARYPTAKDASADAAAAR